MTAGPGAAPAAATAPLSRRHKAAVLLLWLAALALALGVIQRTPFVADLSAFLPDRPDAGQQLLTEQLRSGVAARTLLLGIDGGSADQRIALSKALAGRLRDSGLFERVHNGETGAVADIGGWLFDHRYLLSPAVDAQRFGPDGLRDAIADTLSLLGTPAGNAFKPLLHRDPTGETQRIAEGLIPAQSPRSQEGVWVSRAAPRALMLLTTRGAGADLDAMAQAIARVRSEFAAAQAAAAAPGLELQLSGTPVFSVDSRAQIESEVKWLALSGAILISLLLLLAFGSLPALLVAMLPVITGVLTGIAVVGLGFGNVHGITLGFGATLIGEAVDYAIYYLLQARGGLRGAGQAGWRHWLRHSWRSESVV